MQNLIYTEGYLVRVEHPDGDVNDSIHDDNGRRIRSAEACKRVAADRSRELRGDVSAYHGADVLATYREGREI
jgi:hypothetical protein